MKIITGKTGTAHYQAEDNASFNRGIISKLNFVLNVEKGLVAELRSNNIVRLAAGDIVYNGVHARILSYEDVQIQNGTQGVNRTDVIVARYSIDSATGFENVSLVAIKGSANIPAVPLATDMLLYTIVLQGVNIISVTANFSVLMGLKELQDSLNSNVNNLSTRINTNNTTVNNKIATEIAALSKSVSTNISQTERELIITIGNLEARINAELKQVWVMLNSLH